MAELCDRGSVEQTSPMEEGALPAQGGAGQGVVQVVEFVFCAPLMDHSSSTPLEVFKKRLVGRGHENF